MKKVTLHLNGLIDEKNAGNVSSSLNDLSGVVAADVSLPDQKAYAYAGDRLPNDVMVQAVNKTGINSAVADVEYMRDVNDYKNSLR